MPTIRIPNDDPETWVPDMPKEEDEEKPEAPPLRYDVWTDQEPIDVRG